MHAHQVLPRYERTIWVDGGVQILRDDFPDIVLGAMRDGLALFRHPVRDTVAEEASFCVPIPKYAGQPMLQQVAHYRRRGFPDRSGLWAGGVIARDRSRTVRRLGSAWWRENRRWSYQDQLSLPYLLWRYGVEPGVIPFGLWDGQLISMREHAHEL
jgi:hypothetical protein